MMRIETRHLRLVSVLAEEGTLTKAGRKLFLSQSAVSKQLLELEARLGAPLFLRAGKRLIATHAGLRVLASAGPILQELERVEEEVKRIIEIATNVPITLSKKEEATVDSVFEEMTRDSWVHLACHGMQNVDQPMRSGLLLHDGKLGLQKLPLPNADADLWLGILSAKMHLHANVSCLPA